MIFGRLLMRILLVPLGASVAICVAVLVVIFAHWNRFAALVSANSGREVDLLLALFAFGPAILFVLSASALAMLAPAMLGILISETFAIRSWMFHAINGGLCACVGVVAIVEAQKPYDFYNEPLIATGAGIAAGFAYWAIAGWSAGFWKPVFNQQASSASA